MNATAENTFLLNSVNEIPAGGSDPTCFDVLEVWYPISYVKDLDKSKLTSFTLLDNDLVIWWDDNTENWRVFEDKCPHRLARLSEGRVNESGFLECPYHGWAFSGNGNCENIPQQVTSGQAETSKRACATSLPTVIKQGLLFVYPGKKENAPLTKVPIVEPLEETPDEWLLIDTFRDIPYDMLTLLENVLDVSHVPYTHHRSVGNRSNAAPVELEVLESGKNGFTGVWEEGPRKGTLGRQDTTFIAPSLMWHDLTSKQFGRTLTVVYAVPIRKGECRLFARFPFKFSSKIPEFFIKLTPRWYSHIGQNGVLEDDQLFLHFQERYLENAGGGSNFSKAFYLPTKADRFIFELRQWVNLYNGDPFPGQVLPPPLSKEKLLDRYNSHTKHCNSCRTALANIQKLRTVCAVVTVLLWSIMPLFAIFQSKIFGENIALPAIFSTVFSLFFAAAWFGLGRLERKFYFGQDVPLRNLPGEVKSGWLTFTKKRKET
ncbi:MAG: Rieske 2Fe-2S domain-containing protein [Scytonematopsis contorta HA4267-MV1]|jgi:phenylpropionate dioxygenase-like ring-hydroxylating dioxygenase large terminal subunit|nr:Rieske 2Fe-2S domain-containing protein [Scytonematopsis contorta HA4267-MV1]